MQLFVLPNGSQLSFYVKACDSVPSLKLAIVAHGGTVSDKEQANSIYLATPGITTDSEKYIHYKYIWDCIQSKSRLPMGKYHVKPGTQVSEILSVDIDDPCWIDTEFSNPSVRSRKPFTKKESLTLLKYIQDNNLLPSLNKRSTYAHLEAVRITNHSAESIRSHIRQVLHPLFNKSHNSDNNHDNSENKNNNNNNNNNGHETSSCKSGFSRFTRKQYTLVEDEAIMNYLVERNLWRQVKSRALWKKMAKEGVTNHSSESMRNRFRHHLVNGTYARLVTKLTQSEQVKLNEIFFGSSKRTNSNLENSSEDICHSSYSIDECTTITSDESNPNVADGVNDLQSSCHQSHKIRDKQTSPIEETVQQTESRNLLTNSVAEALSSPSPSFSVSTSNSPGTPIKCCKRRPVPRSTVVRDGSPQLKSTGLMATSSSSLSSKLSVSPVPSTSYALCPNNIPVSLDSSILTSDSSVALRSPSNPEWISQLINCSPYITTPLQATLLVTMTSGSVIEAYNFLTTGKRRQPSSSDEFSPPLWLLDDDISLSSEDAEAVDELVNRFGWTEVIERCKFLKDPD
ncbi:unnamed protein product [Trichobilharzia szidati]|nr:unnamed protein product [Trichobilharzia szidati]